MIASLSLTVIRETKEILNVRINEEEIVEYYGLSGPDKITQELIYEWFAEDVWGSVVPEMSDQRTIDAVSIEEVNVLK